MQEFKATDADIGVRADIFITGQYPDFSRSSLESLFDTDNVKLNSKAVKASYKLRAGDSLAVDDSLIKQVPKPVKLPIIYEDDDVVVIDKPAGVLSHSKGLLNNEPTVASFIQPKLSGEMGGNRAGIVHRLDRGTSGVMIAAKNSVAQTWLQKQFSTRKTKKTYLAVVEGVLEPTKAIIDAPIARNLKQPQSFYVNGYGKPSQTRYKVLKELPKNGPQLSLVELRPLTGRTHQIRVHLKYINHPIVGDHVYGSDGNGLMLHAASLEITLPNRTRRVFSSEPPEYFKKLAGL